MSTPIVDIPMPYGVTVLGDGTNIPKPAARHPKQNGVAGLSLQPGPCRVSVSWEGPEKISVILQNGPNYRTFDTIPEKAGGGLVRGCSPSVRFQGTMSTLSHRGGPSILGSAALSRSILSTRFSSGRGGGVGVSDSGAGGEATRRRHRHNADCLSAGRARRVLPDASGCVRSGGDLAGQGASRGDSYVRPHLGYSAHRDHLPGAVGGAGAAGVVSHCVRKATAGVLPIFWGGGRKCAVGRAGDSGNPDVRGVASAAGGGCAK